MNFGRWLIEQNNRNDPVGDLSRDMRRDRDLPTNIETLDQLLQHMNKKSPCAEAEDAAKEAWGEWTKAVPS